MELSQSIAPNCIDSTVAVSDQDVSVIAALNGWFTGRNGLMLRTITHVGNRISLRMSGWNMPPTNEIPVLAKGKEGLVGRVISKGLDEPVIDGLVVEAECRPLEQGLRKIGVGNRDWYLILERFAGSPGFTLCVKNLRCMFSPFQHVASSFANYKKSELFAHGAMYVPLMCNCTGGGFVVMPR